MELPYLRVPSGRTVNRIPSSNIQSSSGAAYKISPQQSLISNGLGLGH